MRPGGVKRGEQRHHDADALHHQPEVVPQQLRQRADFPAHAHLLQLRAPVVLERVLQHPGHFPGRRRGARDGHHGMTVDLQHLVGTVVDDDVPGGRPAITRHEHPLAELERQDGRRLGLHGNIPRVPVHTDPGHRNVRLVEPACLQQCRKISRVPAFPVPDCRGRAVETSPERRRNHSPVRCR